METRQPDQKLFDAMLIRAYRRFMTGKAFSSWIKDTFGVWPWDLKLKRCHGAVYHQGVRAFVGAYLRPLADRLIDTDPSKDIETLGLLQTRWSGLNCECRTDRSKNNTQYRLHSDEKRIRTIKPLIRKQYDALAPNRKPITMIKVPQGRRK